MIQLAYKPKANKDRNNARETINRDLIIDHRQEHAELKDVSSGSLRI